MLFNIQNMFVKQKHFKSFMDTDVKHIIVSHTNALGGYYGLVSVTTQRPYSQTLHRLRDNLKNPERIALIFFI